MVKTGAKPEQAVAIANMKSDMLSAAGNLIINSSPILKAGQLAINSMAQSGYYDAIKDMAKSKNKQMQ